MNEITQRVVTQVALSNKAQARKNDITFDFLVRDAAHWEEVVGLVGWQLKARALEIWRWWHPDLFEQMPGGDWVLDDGAGPDMFDLDVEISRRVVRMLKRKINREPELQLEDWGDYPRRLVDPQIRMF